MVQTPAPLDGGADVGQCLTRCIYGASMWCAEGRGDLRAAARVLVETMGNDRARMRAGGKRRWADRSLYTDYRGMAPELDTGGLRAVPGLQAQKEPSSL